MTKEERREKFLKENSIFELWQKVGGSKRLMFIKEKGLFSFKDFFKNIPIELNRKLEIKSNLTIKELRVKKLSKSYPQE